MKKTMFAIALICLAAALCLTACGGGSQPQSQSKLPLDQNELPPDQRELAFVFTDEGWSEDHKVYTSTEHSVKFQMEGLNPEAKYRVVLLGWDLSGEVFASSINNTCVEQNGDGTGFYVFTRLVDGDGTYRDLTLAVIGNGEQVSHTFTLEQTGGSLLEGISILSDPQTYDCDWFLGDIRNWFLGDALEDIFVSDGAPRIVVPTAESVYSGSSGDSLMIGVAVSQETTVHLEVENLDRGRKWVVANAWIPPVPGQYILHEFGNDWTPGRYRVTVSQDGQAVDSVEFTMEEDTFFQEALTSLLPQTGQTLAGRPPEEVHTVAATKGIRILTDQMEGEWNEDMTVFSSIAANLIVPIADTKPGVPYFAALARRDDTGTYEITFLDVAHFGHSAYVESSRMMIHYPGIHKDLTLVVAGGGDYCFLNFDFDNTGGFSDFPSGEMNPDLPQQMVFGTPRLVCPEEAPASDSLILEPYSGSTYYGHSATTELAVRLNPAKVTSGKYELILAHLGTEKTWTMTRTAEQLAGTTENAFTDLILNENGNQIGLSGEYSLGIAKDGEILEVVDFFISWELDELLPQVLEVLEVLEQQS